MARNLAGREEAHQGDVAQGMLICKPLPVTELVDWLGVRNSVALLDRVVS